MLQSEELFSYIYDHQKYSERLTLEKHVFDASKGMPEKLLNFFEIKDTDEAYKTSIQEIVAQGSINYAQGIINDIALSVLPRDKYKLLIYKLFTSAFGDVKTDFPLNKRLNKLAKILNLTLDDQIYIAYLYAMEHDFEFNRLCDFSKNGNELRDTAILCGMDSSRLRKTISNDNTLIHSGILEIPRGGRDIQLTLSGAIDDFLSGYSETPYSANVNEIVKSRFSLESFPVLEEDTKLLINALNDKNKKHCILHGAPGTGKTEFVKSIAASIDKKMYTLTFPEGTKTRAERMLALSTMSRTISSKNSILVIDECDDMINTEPTGFFGFVSSEALGKEWLNLFLDSTNMSTVWLTNKTVGMHESLKRRFSVSVYFKPTSLKHRLNIWHSLSVEYGLKEYSSKPKALQLIDAYAPSPADIGSTEQRIAAMFEEAEQNERILLLDEADSLLRDRSRAQHSWEVTFTNELLTQIENFHGIFIACTNLIENIDGAVLRRFSWKVKFNPLTKDQSLTLFSKWFTDIPLEENEKEKLMNIKELSPGDFKAVSQRLDCFNTINVAEIIKELETEASYRKKPDLNLKKVGF